jgi:ATP-binding cassette subfamily B protein
MVGEGGHRLSGGQRQRLAIARAVLKDAPLLILDEATSAVDNETEAALQRSINKISKDRTAVIIAHRLSTVRNADRILVLDEGEVVEDGSHEDLVTWEGIYARMWAVQTGARI